MSDQNTDEELEHSEYEFAIPPKGPVKNFTKRHEELANLLKIPQEDHYLRFIFKTVIALCDPFTQPEETEDNILGVNCISDLLIFFAYDEYESEYETDLIEFNSIKFDITTKFFLILQKIHEILNANDELNLRFLDNSKSNWENSLPKWTPITALVNNDYNLKLIYSVACVLIMSIQKLCYNDNDNFNLSQNPYLHYFLKLWKCHTNIILLGLEIDRRIEFQNLDKNLEIITPPIILKVLKGSSSIRYVLAYVLNMNPSSSFDDDELFSIWSNKPYIEDYIDLNDEPIFNFIQPLARSIANGGALSLDMRLVMIALLIIYSGTSFTTEQYLTNNDTPSKNKEHASRKLNRCNNISEIGDILIDLEYADRFDEDIKYMLEEYECVDDDDDDEEDEDDDDDDESDMEDVNGIDMEGIYDVIKNDENRAKKNVSQRTSESKEDNEETHSKNQELENINIQFDEYGRDWRDIPRGGNSQMKDAFSRLFEIVDTFPIKNPEGVAYMNWDRFQTYLDDICIKNIESDPSYDPNIGQVIINTISKAIKDEVNNKKPEITADKIFKYFKSPATENQIKKVQQSNKSIIPIFNITKFELFLHYNTELARASMDELLMCPGKRRLIIWYLTHNINLSNVLVDYIFQLAAGLRGIQELNKLYMFTRKGDKVILSDVEQSMLLHEFFTTSAFYLSANDGLEIEEGYEVVLAESIAKKLMSILCLMINQLIKLNVIKIHKKFSEKDDIFDYSNELSILLINWIGKVPEARQLYFKLNHIKEEEIEEISNEIEDVQTTTKDELELFMNYDEMTTNEVNQDLIKNPFHKKIVMNFAKKIEQDLKSIYIKDEIVNSRNLDEIEQDFRIFIMFFNSLCKIEELAEKLFEITEAVISSGNVSLFGQISKPEILNNNDEKKINKDDKNDKNDEEIAEFNTDFLNGEGKFKDKKSQSSKSKNKHKKKTKSKRR
ncbi:uncharacterized protein KGF55_001920 [Candida pseudojiufengensis]|uniref:uncharacterized protein n=1 Tax=Candida pseudojiufengensis TaxID=497109 RepID=UPI0022246F2C|nr:uncharacterized protein KGF55_001920 [Candida pseudojiufengensis]KAI5964850.1 hypothetical protein KGF55_001920 [Candida pseudojiufengensis]